MKFDTDFNILYFVDAFRVISLNRIYGPNVEWRNKSKNYQLLRPFIINYCLLSESDNLPAENVLNLTKH